MNTLNIKESNFRRCRRCVSDTTMSEIEFDEKAAKKFLTSDILDMLQKAVQYIENIEHYIYTKYCKDKCN